MLDSTTNILIAGGAAIGLLSTGYLLGRSSVSGGKRLVAKSYESDDDPVKSYCLQHSSPLSAIQNKLQAETLEHKQAIMLGAPEVISLNAALIKALGAKNVIDVGVFTGRKITQDCIV